VTVHADPEVCIGAGLCALRVPEVFDQDDDGTVVIVRPDPDPAYRAAVEEAVRSCPSGAIRLRD
jgi:ferredoxin